MADPTMHHPISPPTVTREEVWSLVSQIQLGVLEYGHGSMFWGRAAPSMELANQIAADAPYIFMDFYGTYGPMLDSVNYLVCAEPLTGNGVFLAVAGVKWFAGWAGILSSEIYVESLLKEPYEAVVKPGGKLKWVEQSETPCPIKRPLVNIGAVMKLLGVMVLSRASLF